MSQPEPLTDLAALARNRARASEHFLQEAAADELQDRLGLVNRTFHSPAVVSAFPQVWHNRFPTARIVPEAESLPFETSGHDLVIHSLGMHWANDPVGQLIQCRRALTPDGLLLATSLGGRTLTELRACLAQAEARVSGGLSPRVAPMADLRDLGGLLQRTGLALPVADSVTLNVSYASAWELMRDLRSMGEGNALSGRLRRATGRAVLEKAANLYAEHFATDDGRITATYEILVLTGWAPDANQPKPLRPGSATTRLADALGTPERPLND